MVLMTPDSSPSSKIFKAIAIIISVSCFFLRFPELTPIETVCRNVMTNAVAFFTKKFVYEMLAVGGVLD